MSDFMGPLRVSQMKGFIETYPKEAINHLVKLYGEDEILNHVRDMKDRKGETSQVIRRGESSWVNVLGKDINLDHVVAVKEIDDYSTGNLACEWDLGFTVVLSGGSNIDLTVQKPSHYAVSGSNFGPREYRDVVEKIRNDFMEKLFETNLESDYE